MRRVLIVMMTIFIIFGVLAMGHFLVHDDSTQEVVLESMDGQDEYPKDLRAIPDEDSPTDPVEKVEDNLSQILPEEDYQEFEVEEEEEEEVMDSASDAEPEPPEEAVAENLTTDNLITVNDDKVNIRAEGSSRSKILGVAIKGQPGTLLETGESWTKVEFDGITGYIGNKFVVTQRDNPEKFQKWNDKYNERLAREAEKEQD